MLYENAEDVSRVARGEVARITLTEFFPSPTGREAHWDHRAGRADVRDTFGVDIVIWHDASREEGFR